MRTPEPINIAFGVLYGVLILTLIMMGGVYLYGN